MTYRRWYPTATTLADGRVLVVSGQRYGGAIGTGDTYQAEIPEIYTPTSSTNGTWQTVNSGQRRLPNYPWMFQVPDGRVFNAGPNYRTGWFNPTAVTIGGTAPNAWSDGPLPAWTGGTVPAATDYEYNPRYYGSAVMYQPGKVMVLGGASNQGVTNTTELLDLNQANPQWQAGAPMLYPRFHANATLLADGSVLATGGTTQNSPSDAPAVLFAELWKPSTGQFGNRWQPMAALDVPRLYHSTAVLLPDATVLTAGGGLGGGYQVHPDYQIFTPPYLCQPGGYRPTISYAPPAVAYGQTFRVQTPDAGNIAHATWVRLSSVTHSFNMNQRFLELAFSYPALTNPASPGGELVITAPADPNSCPPGHYMLFLLDGQGVPSVASIMAVSTSACTASLDLTYTNTYLNDCQSTVHFSVANPVNCQADYQWQVNGVVQSVPVGQTYLDYNATPSAPSPTVQVTATRACAGAPVVAGQALTIYFRGCGGQPYYRASSR